MSFLKDLSIDKLRNAAEDVYNQAKPKTDLEAKIYEVLSHKNWGASTTLLNEIARESFDYDKFPVITRLMWEAIDSRPAAWRVVFKGLTLCEHLIKHGSERCVDDARYHSHQLRSLEKFNFYEGTVDRGIGVREKAKQIVELLGDDERIREERNKAKALREKFGGTGDLGGISGGGGADKYSGFGNSGGGGGYGGNSSYGNSGGYGGSSGGASDSQFSGRYHDKNAGGAKNESSYGAEPTFASIPETKPKKKTKKKKKKAAAITAEVPAAAAAPEVDLFSFDSPAPAPATTAPNDDEFDAFTSARAAPATSAFDAPAPATTANDDLFGSFSGAPAAPPAAPVMDPFAAPTPAPMQQPIMQQPTMQQPSFNTPAMGQPQMNIMGGGAANRMMQTNAPAPSNIMSGIKTAVTAQPDEADDFGDFSGPATTSTRSEPTDPISKLINLDSLSINKKKEDKAQEPIIYNAAAQQSYMTQKQAPKDAISNEFAFSGLDGIQKPVNFSIKSSVGHRAAGQPAMSSMAPSPGMGMQGMSQGMMGMQGQSGMGMQSMGGMPQQGMMGGMQGGMMGGMQQQSGMGMQSMGGMPQQGMGMMGGMQGGMMGGQNMMGGMPQQSGMGMQVGMPQQGMMGGQNMMGGMSNLQSGGMGMNNQNRSNDAGWHGFTS